MTTPQAVHHALLRPCILHILRAAGYHSTKTSVLDTLTDIAARYMLLLARTTVDHAATNGSGIELEISHEDVRMAMQDCGILGPQKIIEDEAIDGEEDTRGMDLFIAWAMGPNNKEIRRVALEGADDGILDYLSGLKSKYDKTEDASRYNGTILGDDQAEPKIVIVEGGNASNLQEWTEQLHKKTIQHSKSSASSRRPSSDLSSLGDASMEGMDFD